MVLCSKRATHIYWRNRTTRGKTQMTKKYCCAECVEIMKRFVREPITFEELK